MTEQPRKAYIVEHVGWALKYLLVYANTVEEATELAKDGEGECLDTNFGVSYYRRARRAPKEDRINPLPGMSENTSSREATE